MFVKIIGKKLVLELVGFYKIIATFFRTARVPLFIYTDCKFHPSCSDYALEAINKQGVVRGSIKSLGRIIRCNPMSKGGVDLP